MEFEELRRDMVEKQLLARGIRDEAVLCAFKKVPRHRFIDPGLRECSYSDFPVSIGRGQTISQPYIVALMVQLLDITKTGKVMEIGTGSGYETAILAELGGTVFTVERIAALAAKAKEILGHEGYQNINIKVGDGTEGWPEFAVFDKIIVTAGSPNVPQPLLDQLANNGRLVIPVGSRFTQRLLLVEKGINGKISEKDICGCVFVPLIGRYGWEEEK